MTVYYNEFKPEAAHMLRQLIKDGLIAAGDVDERSIMEVKADDLKGYIQCHFFAGIGGWSVALRQAGWSDDRFVWTGSCPCQGHSTAGKQKGASDPRNLWPAWRRLIVKSKPAVIFGEQVASAITLGWMDEVAHDLEAEAYSFASAVLPACGVGLPHKRDRIWFVGDTEFYGRNGRPVSGSNEEADERSAEGEDSSIKPKRASEPFNVADTKCWRQQGQGALGESLHSKKSENRETSRIINDSSRSWDESDEYLEWVSCPDGKSRPVKRGVRLLAHGVQHRTPILHAFGNAIVPSVAQEFIQAFMQIK